VRFAVRELAPAMNQALVATGPSCRFVFFVDNKLSEAKQEFPIRRGLCRVVMFS
jgi:hypothetical protein